MTVPSSPSRAGPYTGNGVTDTFAFDFKTFATDEVEITETDAEGVETVLTTGFTVTLNADQDADPGGSVVLDDPLTDGNLLTIVGALPYEQTTDLLGGGNFNPNTIENTFDRTVMLIKQLREIADRTLLLPVSVDGVDTVLPTPEANTIIGWNSELDGLRNIALASAPSTTTADLVDLVPSSGAATTDVQEFLQRVYRRTDNEIAAGVTPTYYYYPPGNVLRYGADPTGVADSYAAFAAAISALGSAGGVVNIPQGTYKIATAIQLPVMAEAAGAIRIVGQGPWATRVNFTGTGYAFTMGDGATLSFFNELHDFALYGTASADGGVKMNGVYFAIVNRIYMRDFTKAGARGIYANTEANYHGTIIHSVFRNIPTGIYLEGSGGIGGNSNTIWRCWFGVHSSEAIHLNAVSGNVINDNEFNGSTTTAIRLTGACDVNKIEYNQFDGPTNSVVFTTDTSTRTQIWGNTGGDGVTTGLIVGRGTNTLVLEPASGEMWGSNGIVIGDASNPATNAVPLTVRGTTSLSTDAFRVEDSASAYLMTVNQSGALEAKANITAHGKVTVKNDVSNNSLLLEVDNATGTTAAGNKLLALKGHASQTGNAIEIQNSSGTVLALVTAAGRIHFGATTSSPGIMSGSGTPEGAVTAPVGSMFLRSDGGAGTSLYIKETGTGNTGWVGK